MTKKKLLTGLFLDVYGKFTVEKKTIPDEVDELQTLIDCRCFDITRRKIGGKYFDIVCDDEGLFRDKPVPSAADKNGAVMLVGNLFIVRHKGADLMSLTDDDFALIQKHLRTTLADSNGSIHLSPVVICEY